MNKFTLIGYVRCIAIERGILNQELANQLSNFDKSKITKILNNHILYLESENGDELFPKESLISQAGSVRNVINDLDNILDD